MCLFCESKSFGFTAASLTRRKLVANSAAFAGIYAAGKMAGRLPLPRRTPKLI